MRYKNYPIEECLAMAGEIKEIHAGVVILQKWTCGNCGSRQTMEEENTFFLKGKCEECGEVTDITECNYMLIFE